MRVLVVCGAGASSTFLVHRMTRLAADRGLTVEIRPGALEDLGRRLASVDIDVVLVGHHLESSFSAIRDTSIAAGVPAVLLPVMGFDVEGAAIALELAGSAVTRSEASVSSPDLISTAASEPGSLHA